jgi:uncharacterized membrane-anchored protein YhcB (DUF1043 family)
MNVKNRKMKIIVKKKVASLSKSYQQIIKKLSKSCQKVVKKLSKRCEKIKILKPVGEEGEEEGDLYLLDQKRPCRTW